MNCQLDTNNSYGKLESEDIFYLSQILAVL